MSEPVAFAATNAGTASGGSGRQTLKRASFEVRKPPTTKGSLDPGKVMDTIEFHFNPKELSVSKTAKWQRYAQKKSKNSGVPEYHGPEPCKLTLEMFLDDQGKSVVKTAEQLFRCCVPTADSVTKKKPNPPWVIFRWGGLTSFTGFMSSVSVKYTLFTPSGTPIRAIANVTLEEISKEDQKQNPTSGTLFPHREYIVLAGDTLASIAWDEYGDPALWRAIATTNRIEDPMRLRAGESLLIPAIEDLHGRGV